VLFHSFLNYRLIRTIKHIKYKYINKYNK
jgi:hypothetical protein